MKCRICENKKLDLVLSLGHQPPSDAFLTEAQLQEPEIYYPLDLYHCERCGLAQLGYVVAKEVLFNDEYPYQTGQNSGGRTHFKGLADSVVSKYGLKHGDLVVDIGGNDGTLLGYFKEHGCEVVNVEPSGVESKVERTKCFWDNGCAVWIRDYFKSKAKVICATNVFAHVSDLHGFMKGVDMLLADDGVFVVEAPSFERMIEKNDYTQIYHEHLSYLDPEPMGYLANEHGMMVFDIDEIEVHGGTFRYHINKVFNRSRAEQKSTA